MRIPIMLMMSLVYFMLQVMFIPKISILGIFPSILLVYLISYAILRNKYEGVLLGGFIGGLLDLHVSLVFGTNILIFALIGYLFGKLNKNFYRESYSFIFMIFLGTVMYGILWYLRLVFILKDINLINFLLKFIMPESLYNILISLFIYPLMYVINENIEERERFKL